jgi:RNA recognition motif-containing protein
LRKKFNFLKHHFFLYSKDLKRLNVKGFSKTTKEENLRKLFPNNKDFFMPMKRNQDVNLGFAFVQFETEKETKKIKDELNGKEFEGKKLIVDFALLRSENNKNKTLTDK